MGGVWARRPNKPPRGPGGRLHTTATLWPRIGPHGPVRGDRLSFLRNVHRYVHAMLYPLCMGRLNLSIPDDLRARMSAVPAEDHEPWSRVASRAFEKELAEIASRRKDHDMDSTLQRLRASKLETESKDEKNARAGGPTWAKEDADWGELERAERFIRETDEATWIDWARAADFNDQGPVAHQVFLLAINPEHFDRTNGDGTGQLDYQAAEEFWRPYTPHFPPSDEFVRAFAEGAAEVYDWASREL